MPDEKVLKISVFGDFRLKYGNQVITSIDSPRHQEFLTYLLFNTETAQSRQSLSFQYWPDSSEKQARNNLRQLLFQIRNKLPDAEHFLIIKNKTCQWNPDSSYQLDAFEFEHCLEESKQAETAQDIDQYVSKLIQAESLYKGALLQNCYSRWIEPYREALERKYQTLLAHLIEQMEEQRDYSSAISYAQKLLKCDEFLESTYRTLMRLYALKNERPNIHSVYQNCVNTLLDELDLKPSVETVRLYEQLMSDSNKKKGSKSTKDQQNASTKWALIGRRNEWKLLLSSWKNVLSGDKKSVFISGEPGIGKSRLVEEFFNYVKRQGYISASTKSYEAASTLTYGPVTEWLRSEDISAHLSDLDTIWLKELTRLIPELLVKHPHLSHSGPISDNWEKIHFFEAITRAILNTDKPRLLVIDDLQWCDNETLSWLDYLMHFDHPAKLLVVGMIRPVEGAANQPLQRLKADLSRSGLLIEKSLYPLNLADTLTLIGEVAEEQPDQDAGHFIYRETRGNPLYIVESIREGVYDEVIKKYPDPDTHKNFYNSNLRIPKKVTEVIASRLNQLSKPARDLIHVAAAVGNECSLKVLTEVSNKNESELIPLLEELLQHFIIREQEEDIFDFTHDKLREVAYKKMSGSRRRWLHKRIAKALKNGVGHKANEGPSRIAYHFDQAGETKKAIKYYSIAATSARDVYANEESLSFLERSIELLDTIPENSEKRSLEKDIYKNMAVVMFHFKGSGASDVFEACEKVTKLCALLDEPVPASILRIHAIASLTRSDFKTTDSIGNQLLMRAKSENNNLIWTEAGYVLGAAHFWFGNFAKSKKFFRVGLEKYKAENTPIHIQQFGQDPYVICEIRLSFLNWILGKSDQSEKMRILAFKHAKEIEHPYTLDYVRFFCGWLYLLQDDFSKTKEITKSLQTSSLNYEYPLWLAYSKLLQGWALVQEGNLKKGISLMRKGLQDSKTINVEFHRAHFLSLLAESLAECGKFEEAHSCVDDSLQQIKKTGDRWIESEIWRIKGEILLKEDPSLVKSAKNHFQKALKISKNQGAIFFEQRALNSIQRLKN